MNPVRRFLVQQKTLNSKIGHEKNDPSNGVRIFLVGGGTGGPIAPLLAVAEEILAIKPKAELYFVGQGGEFEKQFLQNEKIKITRLTMPAGKWRRYFSLLNFFDLFKIFAGFLKSIYLLRKYRPDVIFGAGSFVQVPLAAAAYLHKIPVVIHQQDIVPLLSTRLAAPMAARITLCFDLTGLDLSEFSGLFAKMPKSKIVATGNPVRRGIASGRLGEARKMFNLNADYPTILVIGGGTGSAALNNVLFACLPELLNYVQVIHVTGGRGQALPSQTGEHYHAYEFLEQKKLSQAYAAADLVISRAGVSTISELAALGKVAIVIPLPQSPQEDNARYLAFRKAAIIVFQEFFTPDLLVKLVRKILWNRELPPLLRKNMKALLPGNGSAKIAKILIHEADAKKN